MSKYLIKILSICAFVIVLPLAILGTALCVTETKDCKLSLFIDGEDSANSFANADLLINGESSREIIVRKNTTITITYAGEGYNFGGWYVGNDKTYTTKFSDSATKEFKIAQNTELTAVLSLKTYDVTYSGNLEPDADDFDWGTITYNYGDPLKTKTEVGNESFVGWVMQGTSQRYTRAIFPEGVESATLEAVWGNQVEVRFNYGGETPYTRYIFEQELMGADGAQQVLALAPDVSDYVQPGYEVVGWYDAQGKTLAEAVSAYESGSLEFTLKTQAINYSVKVQLNAKDTETVESMTAAAGVLGKYTVTRPGYTFSGLKYGETVYAWDENENDYLNGAEKLSSVIITNATESHEITLTAVWTANYGKINLNVQGLYENCNTSNRNYITANGEGLAGETSTLIEFNDGANGYDLSMTIGEIVRSKFSNFTYNGKTVELSTGILVLREGEEEMIEVARIPLGNPNEMSVLSLISKFNDTSKNFIENTEFVVRLVFVDAQ